MAADTKSRTLGDDAKDLLARFPEVNREKLFITVIALYGFMNMRYGNKRQQQEGCDFLNFVQEQAETQIKLGKHKPTP